VWQRTEHVLVDLLLCLSVTMPRVKRARSIAGNHLVRSMHEHHGIAASDLPPSQKIPVRREAFMAAADMSISPWPRHAISKRAVTEMIVHAAIDSRNALSVPS
jgi:hypothetical protein